MRSKLGVIIKISNFCKILIGLVTRTLPWEHAQRVVSYQGGCKLNYFVTVRLVNRTWFCSQDTDYNTNSTKTKGECRLLLHKTVRWQSLNLYKFQFMAVESDCMRLCVMNGAVRKIKSFLWDYPPTELHTPHTKWNYSHYIILYLYKIYHKTEIPCNSFILDTIGEVGNSKCPLLIIAKV